MREPGFIEVPYSLSDRVHKLSVWLNIAFRGVWLSIVFRGHPLQISVHRILRSEIALCLEMGQKGVFTLPIVAFVARMSTLLQLEEQTRSIPSLCETLV